MFQKSDYCSVVPNRCFRKLCEFKGQTVPVFSALVSDIADLPKQELWQTIEFDGQTVLFDQFSVTLTLGSGCVVKKWIPQGMEEARNEICGIELHFVENTEEDFVPLSACAAQPLSYPLLTRPQVQNGLRKLRKSTGSTQSRRTAKLRLCSQNEGGAVVDRC